MHYINSKTRLKVKRKMANSYDDNGNRKMNVKLNQKRKPIISACKMYSINLWISVKKYRNSIVFMIIMAAVPWSWFLRFIFVVKLSPNIW